MDEVSQAPGWDAARRSARNPRLDGVEPVTGGTRLRFTPPSVTNGSAVTGVRCEWRVSSNPGNPTYLCDPERIEPRSPAVLNQTAPAGTQFRLITEFADGGMSAPSSWVTIGPS